MKLFKKKDEKKDGNIAIAKKSGKKKVIITAVVVVVIIAALFFVSILKSKKAGNMGAMSVTEVTVAKGDIQTYITGTATIQPKDSYSIISLVKGDVIADYFEEGDIVEEDDVLYQIDSKDVEKSIQSAEISLQKTQNSYNETIKTKDDLNVKSDISGAVTKVNVKKGDSVNNGTVIAEVNDNSKLKIRIPFNANDADNIRIGEKALLSVVGTGNSVEGIVSEVATASYIKTGHMMVKDVTVIVYNPMAITTTDKATAIIGDYACNDAGMFEYYETSTILAKTSGKIAQLNISAGSTVKNGQTVAVLTSDSIDTSLSNASLNLKDSKLSLEKMKESLEDYNIKAPISGTVVRKNVKAGDKIDNTNSSTELAVIYDMSLLKFEMNVDELDINKVEVGQSVTITADALNGKTYRGEITNVSINGTTSNGVTTYPITVEITEFDDDLLPGMNIDATIIISEVKDVISIPVNAVNRGNRVFVKGEKEDEKDMAPDGYKTVEVVTGTSNDDYIEIKEGLNVGDVIYSISVADESGMQMMPGMGGMGIPMGGGNMGGRPAGGNMGGGPMR